MRADENEAILAGIRDAPDLNVESKDRYLRSLRNLVEAVREATGDDSKSIRDVLRDGQGAMRALNARFASRRAGAAPSDATTSAHCVAALALIKRLSAEQVAGLGGDAALRSQWESCNATASTNIREKYDNWRASEQQRANFVPWEELVAARERLARADRYAYGSPDHLLLAFLTLLPPMRTSDYSSLRLFDDGRRPPRGAAAADMNYVQLGRASGTLVVNEYKTANHYRRIEAARGGMRREGVDLPHDIVAPPMFIPKGRYDDAAASRRGTLPPELFRVLKHVSSTHLAVFGRPRNWVFVDGNGNPYTGRTLGMLINRTTKRLFDGKAVTVNLFRHAASNWLDEHHRHDKPVLLYFRHWMMHSVNMQREYVLAHGLDEKEDAPPIPGADAMDNEED